MPRMDNYNLLLITIDTLRADHLGCYGYQKIKTPFIDSLTSQGILFSQAITPVPITLPSHASIMTGQYPRQHGVHNNGNFILGNEAVTLAEIMRDKGYQTAACVGAYVLSAEFGLNQGFDFYEDNFPSVDKKPFDRLCNERKAEVVTRLALQWLREHKGKKFFLWLHYFDPHSMYSPPPPFSADYQGCLYDGEIAYTDTCLEDLWRGVERMELGNKTIIILTADHGQGLGDHDEVTHGIFIYDSTLRVPLIIKGPEGIFPQGKSIQSLVSTIDIFPTIIEFSGSEKTPHLAGKSLLPLIFGKVKEIHEELLCESLYPELNFGWSRLEGLRKANWKYIKAPQPEIYDLAKDPFEKKNLVDEDQIICLTWQKNLERLKENYRPLHSSGQQVQMDPEARERLRSLGYIWTKSEEESRQAGKDPKDMIYLVDYLLRGKSSLEARDYASAIEYFQKIIEVNPHNETAHLLLGYAYSAKDLGEKAEAEFRKVLELNPHRPDVHEQLGLIHYHRRELEPALREFNLALSGNTEYPGIYHNLSLVYDQKGWSDKAIEAVEKALHLDPNFADAHSQAGSLFLAAGDQEKALAHFERAIQINPHNPSAFVNLGLFYSHQGKMKPAGQQFQKAILIDPHNLEAHINLGRVYLRQGLNQQAVSLLEKALHLKEDHKNASNSGQVYHYLGQAYLALGKLDTAIQIMEQGISLKLDTQALHLNLGNAYFEKEYLDKAVKEWRIAFAGSEIDVPSHLMNLGYALSRTGSYRQAVQAWQKAKEFNPMDPAPYYQLGLVYIRLGDYGLAYEEIKDTIRLQPDNQQARLLLDRIKGMGQLK